MLIPEKIHLREQKLHIEWNDKSVTEIPVGNLRRWCPCATCSDERMKESEHFIPIYSYEQTSIKEIKQVGSYALQITWLDGHNTGMYEYGKLPMYVDLDGGITI